VGNIGVRALSDLGGRGWVGGDFLARKIYAILECVIVEIRIQTHSNCTKKKLVHNLSCGGKFFVGVKFRGFWIFQVSRGKKSLIWISDFTRGKNFSRISCTIFESNKKMEAIWSFSLHCLQPISLKFSNVKKGVNFCWIFVLIIADQ